MSDPIQPIQEGLAKINLQEGIFYNTHMELCRDISSLAVSACNDAGDLVICDGMSATGIRGIRYKLENRNVARVVFVEMDEKADNLIKENLKLNGLGPDRLDIGIVSDDFNHVLYRGRDKFNFVEIDPFGSPVPFIRAALLNLRASHIGYLSVTATDTAVLCGAQPKACRIHYGSQPLDNYFCHENAVRILVSHIVRVASPLEVGITPIFSFSKRHYFKLLLKVEKGAKPAFQSVSQQGFISFCPACFKIRIVFDPFLEKNCKCGSQIQWAGPLWLGRLWDRDVLKIMQEENQKRNYKNKSEINHLLNTIMSEAEIPVPFYYDLHKIADKLKLQIPPYVSVIRKLEDKGYKTSRTHFNMHALKTDADAEDVISAMKQ